MAAVVVIGVVALMLAATILALREQGPNPAVVLARRYGAAPVVVLTAAGAASVAVAGGQSRLVAIVIGVAVWLVVVGVIAGRLSFGHLRRGVRRMVLRTRWPSVARASGLAQTRDRRSKVWPGGDTLTRDSERIEYLPEIRWGRALPGGRGVRYRLRPARGGTIAEIAEHAEALAAGLRVHRVEVERLRPHRGRLIVVWRDPLGATVAPPERSQ